MSKARYMALALAALICGAPTGALAADYSEVNAIGVPAIKLNPNGVTTGAPNPHDKSSEAEAAQAAAQDEAKDAAKETVKDTAAKDTAQDKAAKGTVKGAAQDKAAKDTAKGTAAKDTVQGKAAKDTAQTKAAKDGAEDAADSSDRKRVKPHSAAAKSKKAKNKQETFVEILRDNGFTYYMDKRDARWIPLPHSNGEQIIDVWIKLVQEPEGSTAGASYSYPGRYYLEHYYMRPDRQQIQFLCELEVTGRPDNSVPERAYSPEHWEKLVPGSLEDDLYHAVVAHMDRKKLGNHKSDAPRSLKDMLDEYLRIGI